MIDGGEPRVGGGDGPVKIERDVMIPTRDGTRLAANVYLSEASGPVPALVQYTPYLKDGLGGRGIVDVVQRFLARHGYAAVTLDVRGYGASDGTPAPPFSVQDTLDGKDALDWIARQPWCDGTTGMWGVSWGGNTALAVAATRPPSLGAIVAIHAIDDEFTGAAWPHGCRGLLVGEIDWGFRCVGLQLLPPLRFADPAWVGSWLRRLDAIETPFPFTWHEIPPETWAGWATDIEAITVPTLAVSAFHDSYPRETVAYHARLTAPRRLVLGPWKHENPDFAVTEAIGFGDEMVRWFDHWLKGLGPPPLDPPVAWYEQPAGGWQADAAWPPTGSHAVEYFAGPAAILTLDPPATPGTDSYAVDPTVGLAALPWDWTTPTPTVPPDISPDDHRGLSWTTALLPTEIVLGGNPEVIVNLESDRPDIPLRAWLSDVSPSGRSTLISQGWVRPAHLLGGPIPPNRAVEIRVPLNPTSYRIAAGNRLRLAVAGSHFPALVPAPENAVLRVHRSPDRPTRVVLPILDPAAHPGLPAPRFSDPMPERPEGIVNESTHDARRDLYDRTGAYELRRRSTGHLENGALLSWVLEATIEVPTARPRDLAIRGRQSWRIEHAAGRAESVEPAEPVELRLEADESFDRFRITAEVELGGRRVFERTWECDLGASEWRILS